MASHGSYDPSTNAVDRLSDEESELLTNTPRSSSSLVASCEAAELRCP
jgi:hypothetical protein